MNEYELKEKLRVHGLSRYEQSLEDVARNCIRLRLERDDESQITIGASKMGGRPDLPRSIQWPYETQRAPNSRDRLLKHTAELKPLLPLSFIAQINLSEVSALDLEKALPASGIIYFFYSAEQDVWGFDPRDSSGFKVLFTDGEDDKLSRVDFPDELPDHSRFDSCSVRPVREIDLPTPWSEPMRGLFENEIEENSYNDLCDEPIVNKMFGYADNIQAEMELECELVTNGIYVGDPEGYHDPRVESLKRNLETWTLLLQVDSNENDCGMMWGDVGRLFYWIRRDDLRRRKFDKSWLILQCS